MFPLLVTATPAPEDGLDPTTVTPGVAGFVVTVLFVVAVILLIVSMVRRTRRVVYRAAVAEKLDAEEAAARERDD